jgi:hypothetical protein
MSYVESYIHLSELFTKQGEELETLRKQLEVAVSALASMSNQATCRIYIREKLAEIDRIVKDG